MSPNLTVLVFVMFVSVVFVDLVLMAVTVLWQDMDPL
jgi:hypothetical protein